MGASTIVKPGGWRQNARRLPYPAKYILDVIEPCALGVNRAAYTSDPESSAYTVTNPSDTPATADALRDDLVATTLPAIYTSMNLLRAAYDNLRSFVEDLLTFGHETTDKWQGVPTKKLTDLRELMYLWIPRENWNSGSPVYFGFVMAPNHASSGGTLTLTFDRVNVGINAAGAVMADGTTALSDTIPAVTDAQTDADTPLTTYWGKAAGTAADYDGMFLKTISSGNSGASRLQIAKLLIAYQGK